MSRSRGFAAGFWFGSGFGLILALIEIWAFAFGNNSSALEAVKAFCEPAAQLVSWIVRQIYSYDHIGPNLKEVILSDLLLCLVLSLTLGMLMGGIAAMFLKSSVSRKYPAGGPGPLNKK